MKSSKILFAVAVFFIIINIHSQNNVVTEENLPPLTSYFSNYTNVIAKNTIDLKTNKFAKFNLRMIDISSVESNFFEISLKNVKAKSDFSIFDSYQTISKNLDLKNGFFKPNMFYPPSFN